jgi:hypothetical protein
MLDIGQVGIAENELTIGFAASRCQQSKCLLVFRRLFGEVPLS